MNQKKLRSDFIYESTTTDNDYLLYERFLSLESKLFKQLDLSKNEIFKTLTEENRRLKKELNQTK